MKKLLILLICILMSNVYAQKPPAKKITGAFGFNFGQTIRINPGNLIMFYRVTPKIQYRKFQTYDISVTSDQRIFLIRSEFTAPTEEEAQEEIKILEQNLFQKYGKLTTPAKYPPNETDYYREIIINDQKIAIVRDKKIVRIIYRDNILGQEQNPPKKQNDLDAL